MGKRIIRGFSRLGAGAALLVTLCGMGVTAVIVSDQHARGHFSVTGIDKVSVYFPTGTPESVVHDVMLYRAGYPGPLSPAASAAFSLIPPDIKAAVIGLGVTALLALVAFGFFRGLGWVVAGFARD
jgi:hypothetical protein